MNLKPAFICLVGLFLLSCNSNNQIPDSSIKVSGAMRNVMKKGELQGTINLDTIRNKNNLYGLGPVEYLKGELLIIDGESYIATVNKDHSVNIKKSFTVKAPFFVYANANKWKEYKLPKDIQTVKQLEAYITEISENNKNAFIFKLSGVFSQVDFHVINLPDGTTIHSHKDAHEGMEKYTRNNISGDIIGFFSTKHKGIFTHHDTNMHMHFINTNRTEMGHLEGFKLDEKSDIKLQIQVQ